MRRRDFSNHLDKSTIPGMTGDRPLSCVLTVVYSCGTLLLGADSLTVSTLNCGAVMKCESVSVIIASCK